MDKVKVVFQVQSKIESDVIIWQSSGIKNFTRQIFKASDPTISKSPNSIRKEKRKRLFSVGP
jgi:hypothetical protein